MRREPLARSATRRGALPCASASGSYGEVGNTIDDGGGFEQIREHLRELARPRITIVRHGAIGDVVNNLPLLNALREGFPDAVLTWVVEPKALPIIDGHTALDRIVVFPRGRVAAGLLGFLRELRSGGHDVVLDTHRHLKSGAVSLASGCRIRIGFDRARANELNWVFASHHLPPQRRPAVMVEHFLDFAAALGVPARQPRWDIFVGDDARDQASRLLASSQRPYVAVNLGASTAEKCWPAASFAALSRRIAERGPAVVWTGSGTTDQGIAAAALAGGAGEVTNLVGKTDLKTLAAILGGAEAVVACDTGPLHMAVAVGRPVVALFGPSDAARTGPYGNLDNVVAPRDGSRDMANVEVDDVMTVLQRLL